VATPIALTDIRRGAVLPPIGYLDMDKIKRESSIYGIQNAAVTSALNMSAPPLTSPSTVYSGPPPPYSYLSSAASSVVGGGGVSGGPAPGGYASPTHNRQTSGEDRESSHAAPRHSLPSITEALRSDQSISIPSLLTTAPPSQKPYATQSPLSPVSRPFLNTPLKAPSENFPTQNFSERRTYDPMERSNRPIFSPPPATNYAANPSSVTNTYDSPRPSLPPRTNASPSNYSRPGVSIIQHRPPPSPVYNGKQTSRSPPPPNAPFGYTTQPTAFSYPPTTAGITSFRSPVSQQPGWRNGNADLERAEEVRKATAKESPRARPAYGESVKRHLDIFDIETSLNEVLPSCTNDAEVHAHRPLDC